MTIFFADFSGSSAIYFSLFHRGSLRMKRIEKKSAKIPRREGSQIDSTRKVSLCLQCLMFVVLHCGRLCLGPPCANFALQFWCHSWPSMFHHALARKKCTLQKKPGGKVLILCSNKWNSWFPSLYFFHWLSNSIFKNSWFKLIFRYSTSYSPPFSSLFPSQRSLTAIGRKTVGPTQLEVCDLSSMALDSLYTLAHHHVTPSYWDFLAFRVSNILQIGVLPSTKFHHWITDGFTKMMKKTEPEA